MSKTTIIRRVLTLCSPAESQAIIDALVAGTVPDTRGFGPSGMRVAEFLAQHAAGGKYAALYPAPSEDTDSDDPDPFHVVTSSLVCEFWQFDYGDEVHGHIMCQELGSRPKMCATPERDGRLAFLGTCSRRPASTFDFDTSHLSDDNLAGYIFDRDNTAIIGWVQAFAEDMYAACNAHAVSGPALNSADWDDVDATAPGTDLIHDVTAGAAVVEATYLVTVNPDYLGTGA